jgi:hypothetical protein
MKKILDWNHWRTSDIRKCSFKTIFEVNLNPAREARCVSSIIPRVDVAATVFHISVAVGKSIENSINRSFHFIIRLALDRRNHVEWKSFVPPVERLAMDEKGGISVFGRKISPMGIHGHRIDRDRNCRSGSHMIHLDKEGIRSSNLLMSFNSLSAVQTLS